MKLDRFINSRVSGFLLNIFYRLGFYNYIRTLFIYYSGYKSRSVFKALNKDFVLDQPDNIIFEPTFRCNLKCTMCYQNRLAGKEKELSLEQIKYIFSNQIKGIKKVNLIGGEIFIRKDIFEIIQLLDKRNISVHITTNGTLINDTNFRNMMDCHNIQAIGFSIDGPEVLHNKIRNSPNAFQRTVHGLKLAQKKFFVFMVSVLSEENVRYLDEIVETAQQLGLDNFILEFERKYTKEDLREASSILGISEADFSLTVGKSKAAEYSFAYLKEKIDAAERKARELGIRIYYLPHNLRERLKSHYNKNSRENGEYFCRSIFKGRIDSRGNVFHCYAIRKSFGNVLEKPFEEIWNSLEYLNFRRRLMDNNLLSLCETCLYMEPVKIYK